MAKKQTRRSISVSRGTYERLKAYCETNQISMSQFVERRVGDFLGRVGATNPPPPAPQPSTSAENAPSAAPITTPAPVSAQPQRAVPSDAFEVKPAAAPAPVQTPSAPAPARPEPAKRLSSINEPISQPVAASQPPPKPNSDEPLLKDPDAKLTADQIFTF